MEVLHSRAGSEAAAAQLLEHVLRITSKKCTAYAQQQQHADNGREGLSLSFLGALLGQEAEAAVLETVVEGR